MTRGGGFVRLNLRGIEMTLSSGFTGNYLEDESSGYVSLGLYRAFQKHDPEELQTFRMR
jgi:hypothetical protein